MLCGYKTLSSTKPRDDSFCKRDKERLFYFFFCLFLRFYQDVAPLYIILCKLRRKPLRLSLSHSRETSKGPTSEWKGHDPGNRPIGVQGRASVETA